MAGLTARTTPDLDKLCPSKTWPCYFTTFLIENGTLYITSLVPRRQGSAGDAQMLAAFLLELYEASLHGPPLPDCEFSLYAGDDHPDWQLSALRLAYKGTEPPPDPRQPDSILPVILTFSKEAGQPHVLMPFSAHQRCYRDNIDSLLTHPDLLPRVPWAERKPMAFGRWTIFCAAWQSPAKWPNTTKQTGCGREKLGAVGLAHPDLFDMGDAGGMGERKFTNHTLFRYAVSNDGWSASSRLEKVMLTGAAVLKQASPRYGYFYPLLHAYQHYVPYWVHNESDIVQAAQWLRDHDEEAQKIAAAASSFVHQHLSRPARVCYWRHLLTGIAARMRYAPVPCAKRKECVPALQELSFMGHHVACSPTVTVHQQLDEMHGHKLDHGVKVGTRWGEASGAVLPDIPVKFGA